mmetsp:Transcript_1153/g.2555  ORF Transcript_1153/g.2555 Transcript_1153/m.2555 type:complete len:745 (-) Transcript_1153:54-2288(-)
MANPPEYMPLRNRGPNGVVPLPEHSTSNVEMSPVPELPPRHLQSRVKLVEPHAHRLPAHVMWGITLVTAVGMAMLNFITIVCMRKVVGLKFRLMQDVTDMGGVFWGTVLLMCFACMTATACTCLIFNVSVEAGSSGAPENKGWLNGSSPYPPGGYTPKHLLVRGFATILGNASGYPVGREGPTVSMGTNLAYIITEQLAAPYVNQWVKIDVSGSTPAPALMVDEERVAHAKRVACAVGGACGMAMIFDAPLGGILYMFEEMTALCWPLELTFRAFVGTILCALLSRAMLNCMGTDIKAFVIYEWSPQRHTWDWNDVPFFILLAAIMGSFSALHTTICLQVGVMRQQAMKALDKYSPANKMVEAVSYAALCALTSSLVAQMGCCEPLKTGASIELVRYNCDEGEYNPVASLLLTTSEAAVNLLFSRKNAGQIHPSNAFLAFVSYTCLNIGLTGVLVPSGNFTGTMLIGGLIGRMCGALAERYQVAGPAVSGVYAMVGSAAMLCGFKRMNMAVVVFVATAANDFNLVPPLMLSVVVSLSFARFFLDRGYDEEQLVRRKVSFLEPEPPHKMENMEASQLCDPLPPEARLPEEATMAQVSRALSTDLASFPVLKTGQICVGFATRERLSTALDAFKTRLETDDLPLQTQLPRNISQDPSGNIEGEFERLISGSVVHAMETVDIGVKLPVARLVDPVPYTILEEMPAARLYALFSKAGVSTASVVSERGEFRGMITRMGLIQKSRSLGH